MRAPSAKSATGLDSRVFTGIIEEIGTVERTGAGEITVAAQTIMSGLGLGQSVAINGVDLTVAALTDRSFSANIMAETYRLSTLGGLRSGSRVNLERSVLPSTRLSGHLVRGVVEGTARVIDIFADGDALIYRFSTPQELLNAIVTRGPVAVDGTSFTVIDRDRTDFAVSVVAYTASHTTITATRAGDAVNIETDILARYVEAAVARLTRIGE